MEFGLHGSTVYSPADVDDTEKKRGQNALRTPANTRGTSYIVMDTAATSPERSYNVLVYRISIGTLYK